MSAHAVVLRDLPSSKEAELAKASSRTLSAYLQTKVDTQEIEILDDKGTSHPVQIPAAALRLLVDILTEIGEGNAVSIVPIHAELTTQEAADLLNVSRPYLVGLLEKGLINHHKVNRHRRVKYKDLMEYKMKIDSDRRSALDELAAQAQELNMGY